MSTRLAPSDLERTKLGYVDKESFEILAIDSMKDGDWRNPIVEYLQNPMAYTDRKTRYRALSYPFGDGIVQKDS